MCGGAAEEDAGTKQSCGQGAKGAMAARGVGGGLDGRGGAPAGTGPAAGMRDPDEHPQSARKAASPGVGEAAGILERVGGQHIEVLGLHALQAAHTRTARQSDTSDGWQLGLPTLPDCHLRRHLAAMHRQPHFTQARATSSAAAPQLLKEINKYPAQHSRAP